MTTSSPGIGLDTDRPPPVAAVLAGLGHRCSGTCSDAVDELGAELWFVRRRPDRFRRRTTALVVVDVTGYDGSRTRSLQLLRDVNDCLRPDGIRIVERHVDDDGVALAVARPRAGEPQGHRPSPLRLRLVRTRP